MEHQLTQVILNVSDGKAKFNVTVSGGAVTSMLIEKNGHGYTVGETVTINNFDAEQAGTTTLTFQVLSVGDTIGG